MFRGNLENMSITDILEVLSHNQKKGKMVIHHKDIHRHFYVDGHGNVSFVESNAPKEQLGYFLTTVGGVTLATLKALREEEERTHKKTGILLLEKGQISREKLLDCLSRQFQVILTSVLHMQRGSFHFHDLLDPPECAFDFSKPLHSLVLEGMRLSDEYSHSLSQLGGEEMEYVRRRTYGKSFNVRSIDIEVLAYLSDPLPVGKVINLRGYSDFGIIQSMKRMKDLDLVVPLEPHQHERWENTLQKEFSRIKAILNKSFGVMAEIIFQEAQSRWKSTVFESEREALDVFCRGVLSQLDGAEVALIQKEFDQQGWLLK